MFAGHFGVAAAVRAKVPEAPLWALMVATQLIDIAFVPLFLTGIEPMDTSGGNGYGEAVIHAEYTHSLAGVLIIALLAGLVAARVWGRRGGIAIGAVVFSHWILDLLVHRADLPILPGNIGDLRLLGFELWQTPLWSAAAELLLIAVGFVMYARSLWKRSTYSQNKGRVWSTAIMMGILLSLSLVTDFFGI